VRVERALEGRVAVVTGGGRGIGASTAAHLARHGARVVLAARSEGELAGVATAIDDLRVKAGGGGVALPVVCDVAEPEQVERLFAQVDERFGRLDVLVNDAATIEVAPLHELTLEAWERLLRVNLTGTFLCTRAALARMRPARRGVVINVASVSGIEGVEKLPGLAAYAATKGGVIALSEALAAEVAPDGIRVVAVSPGSTDTPMLRRVAPEAKGMHSGQVGKVIAWLATDEAAAVTRTNVTVWGPPAAAAAPAEG
jgi:NAD(P)-dependent dehydrogenase (short-subunit alcohol dehydrogenase family)